MNTERIVEGHSAWGDAPDISITGTQTTGDRYRSMKRQAARRMDCEELTHGEFLDQLLDVYALHLDPEFDQFAGDLDEH